MPTAAGCRPPETISVVTGLRPSTTDGTLDHEGPAGGSLIAGARTPVTAMTGGVSPANAVIGTKSLVTDPGVNESSLGLEKRPQAGILPVNGVPLITVPPVPAVTSFGMIPTSMLCAPAVRMAGCFARSLSGKMPARSRIVHTRRLMSATICLADLGAATKTKAPRSVTIRMMDGRTTRRSCAKCSSSLPP